MTGADRALAASILFAIAGIVAACANDGSSADVVDGGEPDASATKDASTRRDGSLSDHDAGELVDAGEDASATADADTDASTIDAAIEASAAADAADADGGPAHDDAGCATTADHPCGLSPQCGCAAGQTCEVYTSSGKRHCAPGGGTLGLGRACTISASCASGLACDPTTHVCRPYCPEAGTCASGTACTPMRAGPDASVPDTFTCEIACDLTDPASCGGSSGGNLVSGCTLSATGSTDCAMAGDVADGGDCSTADCAPALACVALGGGPAVCRAWCRVGSDAGCRCGGFQPAIRIGGVEYGACQ